MVKKLQTDAALQHKTNIAIHFLWMQYLFVYILKFIHSDHHPSDHKAHDQCSIDPEPVQHYDEQYPLWTLVLCKKLEQVA